MTGLLVVVMKVLMAARKPTSSSNMTSTCRSRQMQKAQTKHGSCAVSYPSNDMAYSVGLPDGLPLQTE